jgi:hypothetical protein
VNQNKFVPDRQSTDRGAVRPNRSRRRRLYFCLSLWLLVACGSSLKEKQSDILSAYTVDVRLGGSVRAILHAHPNHQTAGNGIYLYTLVGPEQVNRLVRLRGENDTILWLQIQDEPVAPNLETEQPRFETAVDRLEAVLGPPRREGTRLTPIRRAQWAMADGQIAELKLEISAERQGARRTLTLGRPAGAPLR